MNKKLKPRHINVEEVNLFYLEANESAKEIIFFVHGNSSSYNTWLEQLGSHLLEHYKLVAFDLPAHGLSDAAQAATDNYSVPGIAKLMAQAISKIAGKQPFLLAGVSLGTNIITEMLANNIHPAGIALISSDVVTSPADLQRVTLPNPNSGFFFQDSATAEQIRTLAQDIFFQPSADEIDSWISDYNVVKAPFRSLLFESVILGKVPDEIAMLRNLHLPLFVIFGNNDKLVNITNLDGTDLPVWRNKIFKIDNAGHFLQIDQPGILNELLAEYAKDQFASC